MANNIYFSINNQSSTTWDVVVINNWQNTGNDALEGTGCAWYSSLDDVCIYGESAPSSYTLFVCAFESGNRINSSTLQLCFDASVIFCYPFETSFNRDITVEFTYLGPNSSSGDPSPTPPPTVTSIRPYLANKKINKIYIGNKPLKFGYIGNKLFYGDITTTNPPTNPPSTSDRYIDFKIYFIYQNAYGNAQISDLAGFSMYCKTGLFDITFSTNAQYNLFGHEMKTAQRHDCYYMDITEFSPEHSMKFRCINNAIQLQYDPYLGAGDTLVWKNNWVMVPTDEVKFWFANTSQYIEMGQNSSCQYLEDSWIESHTLTAALPHITIPDNMNVFNIFIGWFGN